MEDVWVRRCRACGTTEPDASYGRRAVEHDGGTWQCHRCGSTRWEAAGMAMPLLER